MIVTASGRFPIVSAGEHPLRAAVEEWRTRAAETTPEAALHDSQLRAAQDAAQRDLIAEQAAAGLDVVEAGYIPIYDEWFAWAAAVAGVRVENAIRYLDTNTYYHRWHVLERPRRIGPSPLVAACRAARRLTQRPIRACLFGPYTLWAYALKEGEGNSPAAFDALADIWAAEIADLAAAGAAHIQIEESVLLRPKHRGDVALVERALRRIDRAAPPATLILHFACGEIGDLLTRLLDLPVQGLGFDLTESYREPNLRALANWHGNKLLQGGVANAREIRAETPAALGAALHGLATIAPPERCLATPSTALLYLPRHAAFEKLRALVAAAHDLVPA